MQLLNPVTNTITLMQDCKLAKISPKQCAALIQMNFNDSNGRDVESELYHDSVQCYNGLSKAFGQYADKVVKAYRESSVSW